MGHIDVANMFIERGADLSAQDTWGNSPLHLALQEGHIDVAYMLIERGADVSARDNNGSTPLDLTSQDERLVEVAQALIQHSTAPGAHSLTIFTLFSSRLSSTALEPRTIPTAHADPGLA